MSSIRSALPAASLDQAYEANRCYLHHHYAMVMKPLQGGVHEAQLLILDFLQRAELSMAVLEVDPDHPGTVVVLITAETMDDVIKEVEATKAKLAEEAARKSGVAKRRRSSGFHDPLATTNKDLPVLERENHRLFVERFLRFGVQHHVTEPPDAGSMTSAKKLMLTYNIIVRVMDAVSFELNASTDHSRSKRALNVDKDTFSSAWDFVEEVFPLHDEQWNRRFLSIYMKALVQWEAWLPYSMRRAFVKNALNAASAVSGGRLQRQSTRRVLRGEASTRKETLSFFSDVTDSSWAVHAMREHLGERTAFYFAFMHHYTAWLLPLAILMTLVYLAFRWTGWGMYMRALTLLGILVPTLWAPAMLLSWRRASAHLAYQWGLNDAHAAENPNLDAKFVVETKPHSTETYRKFDPNNNRLKVRLSFFPCVGICMLLMAISIAPFAQWHALGKMAPTCLCCEWHQAVGNPSLNATLAATLPAECEVYKPNILTQDAPSSCTEFLECFSAANGPERKFFLMLQGGTLGVLLDLFYFEAMKKWTEFLTRKEHWPTEFVHESHLVSKQFIFCWVTMYFWFLSLAFVYVPFGDVIQEFVRDLGFGILSPMYGWRAGALNLDEAFLAPLVFAQAANLVMETLVPYFKLKCLRKAKRLPVLRHVVRHRAGIALDKLNANVANHSHAVDDGTAVTDMDESQRQLGAGMDSGAIGSGDVEMTDSMRAFEKDVGTALGDALVGDDSTTVSPRLPAGGASANSSGFVSASLKTVDSHAPATPRGAGPTRGSSAGSTAAAGAGAGTGTGTGIGAGHGDTPASSGGVTLHLAHSSSNTVNSSTALFEPGAGATADGSTPASRMRAGNQLVHRATSQDESRSHQYVRLAREQLQLDLELLKHSKDPNQLTAEDVLEQARLKEFHPKDDYLDMVKQFGLVLMFTIVWSFAPLAAVVNNVIEVRFDAFKVLQETRRPVPREDVGIGAWMQVVESSVRMSLPIVAGLAVLATGGFEWWYSSDCHTDGSLEAARMGPDWDCFDSWTWRLLAGVLIERAGALIIYYIRSFKQTHDKTDKLVAQDDHDRLAALQVTMRPNLPTQLAKDAKYLFQAFDADDSLSLNIPELEKLLDLVVAKPLNDHEMHLFMLLIDADDSATVTFSEFVAALQQCQVDFVMRDILSIPYLDKTCGRLARLLRRGNVDMRRVHRLTTRHWRNFAARVRAYLHGMTKEQARLPKGRGVITTRGRRSRNTSAAAGARSGGGTGEGGGARGARGAAPAATSSPGLRRVGGPAGSHKRPIMVGQGPPGVNVFDTRLPPRHDPSASRGGSNRRHHSSDRKYDSHRHRDREQHRHSARHHDERDSHSHRRYHSHEPSTDRRRHRDYDDEGEDGRGHTRRASASIRHDSHRHQDRGRHHDHHHHRERDAPRHGGHQGHHTRHEDSSSGSRRHSSQHRDNFSNFGGSHAAAHHPHHAPRGSHASHQRW